MSRQGLQQIVPSSITVVGSINSTPSGTITENGSILFSGATRFTVSNAFSAQYDNYLINLQCQCPAGSIVFSFGTSSQISVQKTISTDTTITASSIAATALPSFIDGDDTGQVLGYGRVSLNLYCYGPWLTQITSMRGTATSQRNTTEIQDFAAVDSNVASYTDFQIRYTDSLIQTNPRSFGGRLSIFGFVQ